MCDQETQPPHEERCPLCGFPKHGIFVGNNSLSVGHSSSLNYNDIPGMKKGVVDPLRKTLYNQEKKMVERHEEGREHASSEAEKTRIGVRDGFDKVMGILMKMTGQPESLNFSKMSGSISSRNSTGKDINSPRARGVRAFFYAGFILIGALFTILGVAGGIHAIDSIEDQRITQAETRAEYREWRAKNARILIQDGEAPSAFDVRQKKWLEHGKERLATMQGYDSRLRLDKDIITLDYKVIGGSLIMAWLGFMVVRFSQAQLQFLQKAEEKYGPANADAIRDLFRKLCLWRTKSVGTSEV